MSIDFGKCEHDRPITEECCQCAAAAGQRRRVTLVAAASIAPARAKWLWAGRLAVGSLAILAGREGVGKSTVAYWLAAQITRGLLPGENYGRPAAVLIVATEDSWAHTVVPRLIAAEADLNLIFRVDVDTDAGGAEVSLPIDVQAVGEAAREVGAALLLLDPLMSRLSATLDTHKDQETRQALEPLVRMLDKEHLVGVGLLHFNKSGSDDPLTALMGSRAFAAVARSVSTVVRDPDDETGRRRLFGTPKNNLGPDNLPLMSFTLESAAVPTADGDAITSRVVWGEEVDGTISDVLRRSSGSAEDRTAGQEAADWLTDYLTEQGGSARSKDCKRAARAAGHSESSLHRARGKLRVVVSAVKGLTPRETVWELPDASRFTPVVSDPLGRHTTETTETTGTELGRWKAPETEVVSVVSVVSVVADGGSGETTGETTASSDLPATEQLPLTEPKPAGPPPHGCGGPACQFCKVWRQKRGLAAAAKSQMSSANESAIRFPERNSA